MGEHPPWLPFRHIPVDSVFCVLLYELCLKKINLHESPRSDMSCISKSPVRSFLSHEDALKNKWHQNGSRLAVCKTGPFWAPFCCHFFMWSQFMQFGATLYKGLQPFFLKCLPWGAVSENGSLFSGGTVLFS